MKSNCLVTILEETTLELNVSFEDTVDRLMQQQGICRETDTDGCDLEFTCTRKGKLKVYNVYSRSNSAICRIYYVCGEVSRKGDKTIVSVYTVHDRTTVFFRWLVILSYLVALVGYVIVSVVSGIPMEPPMVLMALLIAGLIAYLLFRTNKEKRSMSADIHIMKNELIRRVEAVTRWHE